MGKSRRSAGSTGAESTDVELPRRILESEGCLRLAPDLTLGLLHKLNNVMTAVYFSADGCEVELEPGHPAREMLKALIDSVRQAQQLVKRTAEVNFSLGSLETGYQDLNSLVQDDEDLIRILLPKSASLEILVWEEPLIVRISIADFRRIILNFAINARDALGDDGKVRIALHPASKLEPADYFPEITEELRQGAALVFQDNGEGVIESCLPQLNDPFFTMRKDRLGLGLYHASLVAKRAGGMIAARRRCDSGAEFICVLPRISDE